MWCDPVASFCNGGATRRLARADRDQRWPWLNSWNTQPRIVKPAHSGATRRRRAHVISPERGSPEQKGFGFVTPETGTQDIFVHASTAARSGLSLEQGMPVRVKVRQGVKGPEAVEIASA